jgi:glycosyltransferase involved in cell wall biosynthesis
MLFFPFKKKKPIATVAMNIKPRVGSWGGANQWSSQMKRWLEYHGWKVTYDFKVAPDAILLGHMGTSSEETFGAEDVAKIKKKIPKIPCLQRINDNDIRKDSSTMDALLAKSNKVADHTIFVSRWLRDYHQKRWFDPQRPHSIILPGADPRFFHPIGAAVSAPPYRLVTHHWSDNWKKGFDIYQQIDEWLAAHEKPPLELWIIGRWPQEIQWKKAVTFTPRSGADLAFLLQQCHGYISASRYEPGAMHVVEGLQCGLPLLYHRDSGGTRELGEKFGREIGDDLEETLSNFLKELPALRRSLLQELPSGTLMAASYHQLLQDYIIKK